MKNKNILILLGILVVAMVLRFWNYTQLPFMFDEFSALFRTQFDSFGELIRKGVMEDTHPPCIQVLLYFWVHLFGYSEWVVKLPFTIAGVASVGIVYLIAKDWFNETIGLISAAYLATLQFTIIYSQIARPYISGLFFSLWMVYFWGKLILHPERKFNQNALLFILSASLCAYNHHFSLLFAGIVGLSGLFFIQRKYLVKYIISGILIFALYIPNLPIFFIQLRMGGIEEWLGKPHNDFFIQYLAYIFHFAIIPVVIALALSLLGFIKIKFSEIHWKLILLSLIWFILPFLIGFLYSKYVNAILQFSLLIFSFPFLFFVLFGHLQLRKPLINLIIVVIIMSANIFTLINNRRHYQLFYQSPYEQIVINQQKVVDSLPGTPCLLYGDHKVMGQYLQRYQVDTLSFSWFNAPENLNRWLSENASESEYFYLGEMANSNALMVPIIMNYYPHIDWQKNYAAGTSYLFSKKGRDSSKLISIMDFEEKKPDWESITEKNIIDTMKFTGKKAYLMDSITEWSPTFSAPLWQVIANENNYIDLSVEVFSESGLDRILLASSLIAGDSTIHWSGTNAKIFQVNDSCRHWVRIHHTIKLCDVYLNFKDIKLKCYLWKQSKSKIYIDDFKISLRQGNPVVYGLTEKIPE